MTRSINIHELSRLSAEERSRLLQRTEADLTAFEDKVRPIIEAVVKEGDKALARFARAFDKAPLEPSQIAATETDFAAAEKALDPKLRAAMEFAAGSIRRFHRSRNRRKCGSTKSGPGVFAGDRVRPIPSAACYVPRGKGAFPSVR